MRLFTEDLPIVKTNKELDEIQSKNTKLDAYYVASACMEERKMEFENLWSKFKPYADTNFQKEIKSNFHSRTWEMYIYNVLLGKHLSILKTFEKTNIPRNEGPDFFLNDGTYIECIAVSKGKFGSADSVPEPYIASSINNIICQDVPTDKMLLRITSAIKEKGIDKYNNWMQKRWFNNKSPYVIAINSAELFYPQEPFGIPLVIKALFGLEYLQINESGRESFSFRDFIYKNESPVPVSFFRSAKYSGISGVIFSDKYVLSSFENIGSDCIFVNNPFAENRVNSEFYEKFRSFKADKVKLTKLYD